MTTINMNDVQRFLLIQHLREPSARASRHDLRRIEGLLDGLGDEQWDMRVREAGAAGAKAHVGERAVSDIELRAIQTEAANAWINDRDPHAEPEPWSFERADIEWLRDDLKRVDEAKGFPRRQARLWLRLLDKVDSAYDQARNGSPPVSKSKPADVAAEATA